MNHAAVRRYMEAHGWTRVDALSREVADAYQLHVNASEPPITIFLPTRDDVVDHDLAIERAIAVLADVEDCTPTEMRARLGGDLAPSHHRPLPSLHRRRSSP